MQRWSWAKPLLTPKGIYMSTEFGPVRVSYQLLALITPLFGGKRLLFPIPKMTKQDMEYIRDLAASGRFQPVIDGIAAFEEIDRDPLPTRNPVMNFCCNIVVHVTRSVPMTEAAIRERRECGVPSVEVGYVFIADSSEPKL